MKCYPVTVGNSMKITFFHIFWDIFLQVPFMLVVSNTIEKQFKYYNGTFLIHGLCLYISKVYHSEGWRRGGAHFHQYCSQHFFLDHVYDNNHIYKNSNEWKNPTNHEYIGKFARLDVYLPNSSYYVLEKYSIENS